MYAYIYIYILYLCMCCLFIQFAYDAFFIISYPVLSHEAAGEEFPPITISKDATLAQLKAGQLGIRELGGL